MPRLALIFSGLFFVTFIVFFSPAFPVQASTIPNNQNNAGAIQALKIELQALHATVNSSKSSSADKATANQAIPAVEISLKKLEGVGTTKAAQGSGTTLQGSGTTLMDPMHGIGIVGAISRIIKVFLGLVGAFALIVFVYAGVMYMTAGSSERVKTATNAMKYGALGLVIIMFAYVVSSFFLTVWTTNIVSVHSTPTKYTVPAPPP